MKFKKGDRIKIVNLEGNRHMGRFGTVNGPSGLHNFWVRLDGDSGDIRSGIEYLELLDRTIRV